MPDQYTDGRGDQYRRGGNFDSDMTSTSALVL